MEITIKIGKKELAIIIGLLVLGGIITGIVFGIRSKLSQPPEPEMFFFVTETEEQWNGDWRISFEVESRSIDDVTLETITCSPSVDFDVIFPSLPQDLGMNQKISVVLEGSFETGVRYTFEFYFETEHGTPITQTLKHKF